jgi:CubicO group peptidase (beta-lactamase class C family)
VMLLTSDVSGCASERQSGSPIEPPLIDVDPASDAEQDDAASAEDPDGSSSVGQPDVPAPPEADAGLVVPAFDFALFDESVDAFLKANSLRGASAVVVHRDFGPLHTRGYGEYGRDRLYLIASTGKILSAGILLRLADQGLLDIDRPLSDSLTGWKGHKGSLTLAQLLSMSSGLTGLIDNPLYGPYLCQFLGSSLTDCAKEIYAADDLASRDAPDTVFHYGGGAWQLAGGVAERVSGKNWAELVEETYVTPCGTQSLGYQNQFGQSFIQGLGIGVIAYPRYFDGELSALTPTANPSIEGGAYITASDYGKILLMHLRDGRCARGSVLSPTAVERMREDRIGEVYGGDTGNDVFPGYGMGWWVSRDQPGLVVDPGMYGAASWVDEPRGYAAFVAIEGVLGLGGDQLAAELKGTLEPLFDPSSP